MRHDRFGFWLDEAGMPVPAPPLAGSISADVVIVGGGYAGMWTAWHLLDAGASVVLLEAEVCGTGPSGRNGGFVDNLWHAAPRIRERFGDAAALTLGRESGASVDAVGAWCHEQGVDAWYRKAGQLILSAAPGQDGAGGEVAETCAALGVPEEAEHVSSSAARTRCDSSRFRGGTFMPTAATVHPARLALGLRARLMARGARVHERSPVRALRVGPGDVTATTDAGACVNAGAVVLAAGVAVGAAEPLRHALTGVSSHMVITEPVPDVLDDIGWRGGEAITDGRALVHYFRTTRDDRIAFGWGGGRILAGARRHRRAELDPPTIAQIERDLVWFFPQLRGRPLTHAWGGPIDASPTHLPTLVSLPGSERAWAVFGFTGNGVGPTHLAGRILADVARGDRTELTRLPIVDPPGLPIPPEPLRWFGGTVIREGIERKERAEEDERPVSPVAGLLARVPELLGMHIGR